MHLHHLRSQSLFAKTLFTIAVVTIAFQLVTLSTLAYYMVVPLGQRATDDLAMLMTHAAEKWDRLSMEHRQTLSEELLNKHDLVLTEADRSLPETTSQLPYISFLEHSLTKHYGQVFRLKESRDDDGEQWFWADTPISNGVVRFGFPRSRIGVKPPVVFFVILVVGTCLTFLLAIILTRRLTIPVDRLYRTAQSVGKGQWPEPIKEEGPEELVILAREFNRMSVQVKELLANRTTLLAGISHDLRTPLTQIQLALSMLPNDGGNPELMESIRSDLNEINRLIGVTMSISLELEEENVAPTDIAQELDHLVKSTRKDGVVINFSLEKPCSQVLHPLALHRILVNLLTNAVRYGDGKPIDVSYECNQEAIHVRIMDRGQGIPQEHIEDVFRPFYRLERSRGSKSGGSGLGLAVVQQLADANGWKVQLQAREGGGTEAVLTIPYDK